MKLLRFELKNNPGVVRSGMVFSGRIYETDGATAIGMHESEAVRPLAPVGQPQTVRFFHSEFQPQGADSGEDEPRYFYGNPACLVGASQLVNDPELSSNLGFESYVAAIVLGNAYKIDLQDADDAILGVTILTMLVPVDVREAERRAGGGFGRAYDVAGAFGPVITTPDELDDLVTDAEFGRRYSLEVVSRVNGVERSKGNTQDLPITFAQAIAAAAQSCTLHESDIIALGPIASGEHLEPGDEVQTAASILGSLSLKLSLSNS